MGIKTWNGKKKEIDLVIIGKFSTSCGTYSVYGCDDRKFYFRKEEFLSRNRRSYKYFEVKNGYDGSHWVDLGSDPIQFHGPELY